MNRRLEKSLGMLLGDVIRMFLLAFIIILIALILTPLVYLWISTRVNLSFLTKWLISLLYCVVLLFVLDYYKAGDKK